MPDPQLIAAHLLRLDGAQPALLGSRCCACGEVYFPAAHGCTRCCGTRLEAFDLGHRGRLWSWTVQDFCPKPPYDGAENEADFRSYGVGYVEMACGIKVESRLTLADPARLHIGMAMELTLDPYRHHTDGTAIHTYAFRPLRDEAST
ncbi:MAG TPA: OB-fold domain-containing protein [Burkholderiaceae bacterium]|nr:OB-fold domain-containing protein [Burkholderiaceae bacterium]